MIDATGGNDDVVLLDTFAFFTLCHHLSDYLATFDNRSDVNGYVRGSLALSACRDLVTNLKHAQMRSEPFSPGGKLRMLATGGNLRLTVHDDGQVEAVDYVPVGVSVVTDSRRAQDAWELAQQCAAAWVEYGLPKTSRRYPS